MNRIPYIAVDFDRTLSSHENGEGINKLGVPIEKMINRVKSWIQMGIKVKILTARVAPHPHIPGFNPENQRELIHEWCKIYGLPELDVVCYKDMDMIELWDDRAISVNQNTGDAVRFEDGKVKIL